MFPTKRTFDFASFSASMTISLPDIMDETRHFNSYNANILGLDSVNSSKNSATLVSLATNQNLTDTNLMGYSSNFPYPNNPGIQFLWILSKSYQPRMAIHQS